MKILIAMTRMGGSMRHEFHSSETAEKAYAALRDAMAEYKEFGNDKLNSVEISLNGGVAAYRLSELASVTLDSPYEPGSDLYHEKLDRQIAHEVENELRRKKAFEAAGLPVPPKGDER